MNWLAHIFLSEQNIDFQIGNYLADPLKGRPWDNASQDLINGMKVHKIIDSYTDAHEEFLKSKSRLGNKGLLKAIVIDLTYDYLLTKNWNIFSNISIDDFLQTFYTQANERMNHLPIHASTPLKRMIEFDLLNKYQNLEHLKQAFERVDRRLSQRLRNRDLVINYFDRTTEHIDYIEEDFMRFFPELQNRVKNSVNNTKLPHWKSFDSLLMSRIHL